MTTPAQLLEEVASRLIEAGASASRFRGLPDADVLDVQRAIASLQHEVSRWAALSAAEVAHRSRPEFGGQGLAQRQGHANAEAMLQAATGASKRDARSLARLGAMIAETAAADELTERRSGDPEVARAIAPVERPERPIPSGRVSMAIRRSLPRTPLVPSP